MKYRFDGSEENGSMVRDFSFLSQLESFSLGLYGTEFEIVFPKNIKKLTLLGCCLPWLQISRVAKLPYLEVLKLLYNSIGGEWHVEEGAFLNLKFLKLQSLDIVKWIAPDDQFSNLEKLALKDCTELKEIPECLENVAALETIEVINCPDQLVRLLKKVEECQKEMGNSVLQFHERGTRKENRDVYYSFIDEQSYTDPEDSDAQ